MPRCPKRQVVWLSAIVSLASTVVDPLRISTLTVRSPSTLGRVHARVLVKEESGAMFSPRAFHPV